MSERLDEPGLIRKERSPGRSYDLFERRPTPEVFVDGASEASLGPFVTKLTFHTVRNATPEDGGEEVKETREVALRLVIPTSALVEMSGFLTALIKSNSSALVKTGEDLLQQLRDAGDADHDGKDEQP